MLHNVVLGIHLCTALAIIGLVLLQHGKGADAGAAFGAGAGASATVFGARGASSFFSRATGILAAVFFLTSLTLGILFVQKQEVRSVTDSVMMPTTAAPVVDLPPALPPAGGDMPNTTGPTGQTGSAQSGTTVVAPGPVESAAGDRSTQPSIAPPPPSETPPAP
jgi:preprotein translocase subunit SecG